MSHLDSVTPTQPNSRAFAPQGLSKDGRWDLFEIFDNLPAAIYTTDAQGRLLSFNSAAVEFSGRVPELGTDQWYVSLKLFRPDGTPLPHDQSPMAISLRESRPLYGEEAIAERPDGTRRWFLAFPNPIRDANGDIIGGINMLLDITERKQGEQTSNLLAAIVDSSDDVIVSKDLNGYITSWNKSAERIFGYTAQEAVGQHITMIIPADRRHEEDVILARLRRGERIDHFDTIRRRKDGTLVDISLTVSPVRDATGRIVGASKVARDVTDRKRAAERLRQVSAEVMAANAKFRAMFEQTSVFAGIMTHDGTLVEANNSSLEGCGFRAEEVLNRPFWEGSWWRNHPESQAKIKAATPLVANGVPFREILRYSWADGSERLVEFALYPITDQEGRVLFLHPTGVDITDLKRTEELYRKLAETLELKVRERTKELEERNADVLRQSEQLRELSWRLFRTQDEERRHIARELHDSAGQMLAVLGMNLNQLTQDAAATSPDLARQAELAEQLVQQLHKEIRTTSYLLHPPLLDETGLALAVAWYTEGLTQRSGLKIDLNISPDFGRIPRDMELVVFRVIQECLTNIHRHSGAGRACIRVAREEGMLRVEVEDNGCGIPAERIPEVQTGGFGVGFRGMRERIRQFKGDLQIQSNSSGTKITVTIPVPMAAGEESSDPMPSAV